MKTLKETIERESILIAPTKKEDSEKVKFKKALDPRTVGTYVKTIELRLSKEEREKIESFNDLVYKAMNRCVSNSMLTRNLEKACMCSEGVNRSQYEVIERKKHSKDKQLEKLKDNKPDEKEKIDKLQKEVDDITERFNEMSTHIIPKEEVQKGIQVLFNHRFKNNTYDMVKTEFPDLPSTVYDKISYYANKKINKDYFKIDRGEIRVPSYNKGLPIPFKATSISFEKQGEHIGVKVAGVINARLEFGKDRSGNRETVYEAMANPFIVCDSSIKIKKNKVFLLLVLRTKHRIEPNLTSQSKLCKPENVLGVDTGINQLLAYATNCSTFRGVSGGKHLKGRVTKMFEKQRLTRQGVRTAVSGKGRNKKTKAADKINQRISNYQKTEMNKEAKFLVKNAIKQKCGTIHMEDLTDITKDKNELYFKSWPYYMLQQAIERHAKKYGINVRYIKPAFTSQECSCCGNIDASQRVKGTFTCANIACDIFEKNISADTNAAANIAKSTNYSDKKLAS